MITVELIEQTKQDRERWCGCGDGSGGEWGVVIHENLPHKCTIYLFMFCQIFHLWLVITKISYGL